MIALHALYGAWLWYWRQALGNVLAVPPCGLVAGLGAFLARDRIGRRLTAWLAKHHRANIDELAAAELARNKPAGSAATLPGEPDRP